MKAPYSMQMTPNFSLEEFTRSDAATTLGIPNTPTDEHLANLRVVALGMEMVRRILARPIHVRSGYRSPAVNKAVGGTPTSAHALGLACDFAVDGMSALTVCHLLDRALPYDQLIQETGRGTVHISFDPRLRMENLTQAAGPGTEIVQGFR